MNYKTVTYRNSVTGELVTAQLVPIGTFPWSNDYSWMRTVTCINHPTAQYLTKNPYRRTLHTVQLPEGKDIQRTVTGECPCPFSHLAVVVVPGSNEEKDMNKEKDMNNRKI
jgi:hypothetical protein